MCAAPATSPAMIREFPIFLNESPANGAPFDVGTDMSTIQFLRFVNEPEEVACAAEEGRMMCRPV
jgi:hypothetical protein